MVSCRQDHICPVLCCICIWTGTRGNAPNSLPNGIKELCVNNNASKDSVKPSQGSITTQKTRVITTLGLMLIDSD